MSATIMRRPGYSLHFAYQPFFAALDIVDLIRDSRPPLQTMLSRKIRAYSLTAFCELRANAMEVETAG